MVEKTLEEDSQLHHSSIRCGHPLPGWLGVPASDDLGCRRARPTRSRVPFEPSVHPCFFPPHFHPSSPDSSPITPSLPPVGPVPERTPARCPQLSPVGRAWVCVQFSPGRAGRACVCDLAGVSRCSRVQWVLTHGPRPLIANPPPPSKNRRRATPTASRSALLQLRHHHQSTSARPRPSTPRALPLSPPHIPQPWRPDKTTATAAGEPVTTTTSRPRAPPSQTSPRLTMAMFHPSTMTIPTRGRAAGTGRRTSDPPG